MTNALQPAIVTLDGDIVAIRPSHNDAFKWLLDHRGQSVHYATTHAGFAIVDPEPWSAEDRRRHMQMASIVLTDHGHGSGITAMERESCGACVLAGYQSRESRKTGEWNVNADGPNFAGWARIYVEGRRVIPAKWRDAFLRELTQDGEDAYKNYAYAHALARSIVTYGVRFGA